MSVERIEQLSEPHRDDLHRLYKNEWWTVNRDRADIDAVVDGSDVVVGFANEQSRELVGFARAITDGVYKALVFDVIVAPDYRGLGIGDRLLSAIVAHPALSDVEHLELYCRDELVPFYERWGFSTDVADVRLMRRAE